MGHSSYTLCILPSKTITSGSIISIFFAAVIELPPRPEIKINVAPSFTRNLLGSDHSGSTIWFSILIRVFDLA